MDVALCDQPTVTVITVCYNSITYIGKCIESVLSQTWPHVEYIIIDGGSTDGTRDVLCNISQGIQVYFSDERQSIYESMNWGLRQANGDYIIFMNSDDYFFDSYVIERFALTAHGLDCDVFYGQIELRNQLGPCGIHVPPVPAKALEEFITGCLPHQATFAHRRVFGKTGPFDTRYKRHSDYDWWLKVLAESSIVLKRLDFVIASYFVGGVSSNLMAGQPEVIDIQEGAYLYNSDYWDRERARIFHKAWIDARIEVEKLTSQIEVMKVSSGLKVTKCVEQKKTT